MISCEPGLRLEEMSTSKISNPTSARTMPVMSSLRSNDKPLLA